MQNLLRLVMRGRIPAAIGVALTLLVPLCSVFAGGIVGLVTLRHGAADAMIVLVLGSAAAGAVLLAVVHTADPAMMFALTTGLPVIALAGLLRMTASLGLVLSVAAAVTAVAVVAVHLSVGRPLEVWRGLLDRMLGRDEVPPDLSPEIASALAEADRLLDAIAPAVPSGLMVASMVLLFLARWWHAILDNPGGFGREFHALRVDPRVTWATFAAVVLAFVVPDLAGGLPVALLQLALVTLTFQGLAIAHAYVAHRGASKGWLGALYLSLLPLVPLSIYVLATLGLVDARVDFRRRWSRGAT